MKRTVVGEIMDSPDLDRAEHLRALEGLRRINKASHVVDAIASRITAWARQHRRDRLSLLDIACGGGDVPLGVVQRLIQQQIHAELTLIDRSPLALERAQAAANELGLPVRTCRADAVAGIPDTLPPFDVVTNSLFLHHLERPEVVRVLSHMRSACRGLIVISDLRRSPLGWVLAWAGCRILSRSPVVHFDGPASVRAAWTLEELRQMARDAGLPDATIQNEWPWRMSLVWQAPHAPLQDSALAQGAAHAN